MIIFENHIVDFYKVMSITLYLIYLGVLINTIRMQSNPIKYMSYVPSEFMWIHRSDYYILINIYDLVMVGKNKLVCLVCTLYISSYNRSPNLHIAWLVSETIVDKKKVSETNWPKIGELVKFKINDFPHYWFVVLL